MMNDLQISDAVPFDDGSFSTDLLDTSGNVVATVTRMADGTAEADVSSSAGVTADVTEWLRKASSFLDGVAKAAKSAQGGLTRIENAAAGAKVGFNLPTTATPYLIAIGVLGVIAIAATSSSRSRR